MACGGAQVRDARELVPVRQATAGTADHVGGFSYARTAARPSSLRWVGNRLVTRSASDGRRGIRRGTDARREVGNG